MTQDTKNSIIKSNIKLLLFEYSSACYGTFPLSEKESSALRDLIKADNGSFKSLISIQSYSQLWLSPYGYKLNTLKW